MSHDPSAGECFKCFASHHLNAFTFHPTCSLNTYYYLPAVFIEHIIFYLLYLLYILLFTCCIYCSGIWGSAFCILFKRLLEDNKRLDPVEMIRQDMGEYRRLG